MNGMLPPAQPCAVHDAGRLDSDEPVRINEVIGHFSVWRAGGVSPLIMNAIADHMKNQGA